MDNAYQTTLLNISQQLGRKDLSDTIFLCGKYLRESEKENITDGTDLFSVLQHKSLICKDDLLFLKELLSRIDRKDILTDELKTSKTEMEELKSSYKYISPYRSLLYEISQSLTTKETENIMFLLRDNIKNIYKLNKEKCMIVVLSEMEKKRLVSEDNLQSLKAYLENIKRADLCESIEKFEKKQHQRQDRRLDLDAKLANISIQEESDADVSQPGMQNDPPLKDDQSETYKLNKCPHGWCIIVNNHDFNEARSKKIEMNDRNGTHKDAEKIKEIFHSRGYEVKNHDNVTSSKMLEIMENYAKRDHSERDSFVCFVLSHGDKGTVFGTDGKDVKVKDLTDHFNGLNSPSLVGKPKVFFIQACQGGNSDTGVPYVSDRNPTEYINDSAGNKLPITADFLTAFASVEDYESLRNIYTGSVYIQSLCKFLQDPQFLETDLTRILTKVHKKVSDEVYSIHKNGRMQSVMQMPTYKSELRKTLILPPPFIGQQESRLCHQ